MSVKPSLMTWVTWMWLCVAFECAFLFFLWVHVCNPYAPILACSHPAWGCMWVSFSFFTQPAYASMPVCLCLPTCTEPCLATPIVPTPAWQWWVVIFLSLCWCSCLQPIQAIHCVTWRTCRCCGGACMLSKLYVTGWLAWGQENCWRRRMSPKTGRAV